MLRVLFGTDYETVKVPILVNWAVTKSNWAVTEQ